MHIAWLAHPAGVQSHRARHVDCVGGRAAAASCSVGQGASCCDMCVPAPHAHARCACYSTAQHSSVLLKQAVLGWQAGKRAPEQLCGTGAGADRACCHPLCRADMAGDDATLASHALLYLRARSWGLPAALIMMVAIGAARCGWEGGGAVRVSGRHLWSATQHAGRAALAAVLQQLHVSCAQGRTRLAPPALLCVSVYMCVHVCTCVQGCEGHEHAPPRLPRLPPCPGGR